MRYGQTFTIDKITSGLQRGLKQGAGAVKKGAMVVKDKTGQITREGAHQLAAIQKKTKESLKRVFKKVA